MTATCQMRDYVAAYALAALEPDESTRLREHLPTCAACRDELADLDWIPQLLPLVPMQEIERFDDPPEAPPAALLDRLVSATMRETGTPRGRRASAMVGAAALLAAVGTLSAVAGSQRDDRPQTSTVAAVDPRTHVSATVTMARHEWGTQLNLDLKGAYPGGTCTLVARADDGHIDTAATWVASAQGTARVPGATAIPTDHLAELDVLTPNGHQLVRIVMPH